MPLPICSLPACSYSSIYIFRYAGRDLSKLIKDCKGHSENIPAKCITSIMKGVVQAVMHIQKYDIVHCDIKPHNVMFNW